MLLRSMISQQQPLGHIDLSVNSGEFILSRPFLVLVNRLIRLYYQEEKLTSGSAKVGEFDLTRLARKMFHLRRSTELFSRIINSFQRKQLLKRCSMPWKLLVRNSSYQETGDRGSRVKLVLNTRCVHSLNQLSGGDNVSLLRVLRQ